MTVRNTAKFMEVNKNTAMRYRSILLTILKNHGNKEALGGDNVQVDETYITLSTMVHGEKKLRGISNQKASIAIGIDSNGGLLLNDIGNGHPTSKALFEAWDNKIQKGSTIT